MERGLQWKWMFRKKVGYYQNQVIRIDDTDFVLSTLWSRINPNDEYFVWKGMNDFCQIKFGGKLLQVEKFNRMHETCMDFIRKSMLKFNEHKAMNERIIDRKLFVGLAQEVGLNASHIKAMGEMRHCEITVSGDMLERLVEIQRQFERLAVMGDDEHRGFYIEVSRPTPEEWGDIKELVENQMKHGIGTLPESSTICRGWLMLLLQIPIGSTTM